MSGYAILEDLPVDAAEQSGTEIRVPAPADIYAYNILGPYVRSRV